MFSVNLPPSESSSGQCLHLPPPAAELKLKLYRAGEGEEDPELRNMHNARQQQMKNFILDKRRGLLVHFSLKYSALLVYVRLGLSLDELVELS